jgi:cell division protein FtsW
MRELRVSLFSVFVVLLCFGTVMIYSSSGVYAFEVMKDGTYFLMRHVMFLAIGAALTWAAMLFDYRRLQKWAKPLLLIAILMLGLVLVPHVGKMTSGARRWFSLGFFNFQPSEFVKLALIVYLADLFSRKQGELKRLGRGFLPVILVMGLLCSLIIKQPDLGNTVLVFVISMSMYLIAGGNWKYVFSIFLAALPVLAGLIIAAPYRMRRMVAFMNPWEDAQGAGFQLSQSQIALGSGGLFGVGLGKSEQKLFYLPAAHTDFIFSIIGEELGFLGAIVLIGLFVALVWHGTRILKQTADPFGYYLCFGILVMISIQVAVNVGVSVGALPTKGLPLPFISYGGSALIFNMIAVGLMLNVSRTQDLGG